ncbi:MAG: heme exporter protein CcmB [Candidatus Saccharibacteria bacterium]|nr:heme exporter protein CcmB [Moraxellaceae bacterium]
MSRFVRVTLRRELLLRVNHFSNWIYTLVFFVLVLLLFPLAVGANPQFLNHIGVAAVWIAAVLAVLLGMEGLFRTDVEDGTLEQVIVARQSLALWALVKVVVHWLTGGFAIVLLSVLSIPLFGLNMNEAGFLALSLLLGTPILTLLAAIAAALTVSLKSGGVLMSLIALPLQLPVLIFATGAIDVLRAGGAVMPILALLAAGLILSVIFIPFALASALRLSV